MASDNKKDTAKKREALTSIYHHESSSTSNIFSIADLFKSDPKIKAGKTKTELDNLLL